MKSNQHKPCSRGEMRPAVSFVSATPLSPGNSSGLSAPGNFQLTHSTDVNSPASLPSRRVKGEKKATKSLHSGNSTNSLLVGFEDADTFPSDQDQDIAGLLRRTKTSDMRLLTRKRQEITQIQRLLTHQQEIYMNLYAQIKDMEAKCGLDPGNRLGEMRVLTMKGWSPHDLLFLISELPADKQDASDALESAVLDQLKFELSTIPKMVTDLGAELTARRTKVLEYIRKRVKSEYSSEKNSKNVTPRKRKLEMLPDTKSKVDFDSVTEFIHEVISDTAKQLEVKINRIVELAKTAWRDRDSILKKIDCLNKELCALQSRFNKQNKVEEKRKKKELEQHNNEQIKKTDSRESNTTELKDKLTKERIAREALKHTVTQAENMLRAARTRITQLERELNLTQKELQASMRKHKEYVTLHRNRVNTFDVHSKKLMEESKTGEVTIEMLSLQRDALEFRVKELHEQNKALIESNEAQQTELQARLARLQDKVEEQEQFKKTADARAMDLENQIKGLQDQCRILQEQSKQLVEINSDKCPDYLPHKEDEPSKREIELWADLQLTKKNLARVMEDLKQSREDKESLLNSLAKIAHEGSDQNMAKELLLREQKNFELQQVIKELKENMKSMMDTIAQKDNQLVYLKLESARMNYECNSNDSPTSPKQELAIEVIDLNAQVVKLKRERESLINDAMTRSLMLERYERSSQLFAQMTRVRRNLAEQLEGGRRPDRLCSEGAFQDANLLTSMSSSCLKAAKTWDELRTDRERVLQLQEVVASQNIQLQRECRIRNHLEQRRAVIERMFLNRNQSAPDQYNPGETVAAYFGASKFFVNDS